jgi:hypothetical protein
MQAWWCNDVDRFGSWTGYSSPWTFGPIIRQKLAFYGHYTTSGGGVWKARLHKVLSIFLSRIESFHSCIWRLQSTTAASCEPLKVISYYHLSRSTWPLSNNKELFCRLCRFLPGKSLTTGSLICAKPTRRREQSTNSHYIKFTKLHYYIPGFIHKSKGDSEFKQRK